MMFVLSKFPDEQQCVEELESLFMTASQQNENLVLRCTYFTYLIRPTEEAIRRMQKWKQIYEELQSS